ncbi:hypothetical protein [Gottfriedia acidiceleris]|uniref:hypothetical protein n=1 Tax=Gottfriedia acidiceleris TaxID=371036 RepID=UPI00101D828F|nr:hypothetical protein [Gottfriedia acidiceleris]
MKKYMILVLIIILLIPKNIEAANEKHVMVSKSAKENITLYAEKIGDMYKNFKIDYKGETYFRPFWMNVTNPTYAPKIFYEDINKDKKKELIITLTKGTGTGVLDEEVYVYRYTNGLVDELVDNPLAIIYKNVKTKLSTEKAEVIIGDKVSIVDTKSIEPTHLFEDVAFGSIIDYEVIKKQLMVRVSGQITPAMFAGDIIIVYEYRDKMYQAKTIEFIPYYSNDKNPFYGPTN